MRLTPFLLPALAAAQAQKPLAEQVQGWFDKAKSYIPTAPASAVSAAAAGVADQGASAVASRQISELTTTNWEEVLRPRWHEKTAAYGPDSYMVLVTGGNRTCGGQCERMSAEFNKTSAMLAAERDAPHLAVLDCDKYGVLCSTWFAGPPTLWHITFPQQVPGQKLETPVHIFHFNTTSVTAEGMARIHKERTYQGRQPMVSMFHPWDGKLAEFGVQKPLGYVLFAFSMIPSWSLMILVSFMTRSFMNNRVGNPGARAARNPGQEFANRPLGGAPPATG